MKPRRPVTRVCLVLPAQSTSSGAGSGGDAPPRESGDLQGTPRGEASAEHEGIADLMAREMASHGVSVTRHVAPGARERGVRVDVAVWFSHANGQAPRPDAKEVPARVHVLLSPGDVDNTGANAARYDAVFVPHASLQEETAGALSASSSASGAVSGSWSHAHRAAVSTIGLPLAPVTPRASEKKARLLGETPVVLVDVRDRFFAHIDRVLFQLALTNKNVQVVLLVPESEQARARVRELADRSGLDAWLTSGDEALSHAAPAIDLFIGRPSWTELIWLAAHRVQVAFLAGEGARPDALLRALRDERHVDEVAGVLHLAAYVDRRLEDLGGVRAKGTLLEASFKVEARSFLEALGDVEPRPVALRGGWEAVGPNAGQTINRSEPAVVDARVSPAGHEPKDRAAAIEDALDALKKKLADDSESTP